MSLIYIFRDTWKFLRYTLKSVKEIVSFITLATSSRVEIEDSCDWKFSKLSQKFCVTLQVPHFLEIAIKFEINQRSQLTPPWTSNKLMFNKSRRNQSLSCLFNPINSPSCNQSLLRQLFCAHDHWIPATLYVSFCIWISFQKKMWKSKSIRFSLSTAPLDGGGAHVDSHLSLSPHSIHESYVIWVFL